MTGINGCGKSTVIQSLLALRQSIQSGSILQNRIQLRGNLVDLGRVGEVYCAEPSSDSIELLFSRTEGPPIELRCPGVKEYFDEYFLQIRNGLDNEAARSLFVEPFNYINAERVGPRKVFQIPAGDGHPLCVGKFGENAPYIVASKAQETVVGNEFVILESSDGKEYPTIQYQWALWMSKLFPGFDEEHEIYKQADEIRLWLALQRGATGQPIFVRPTNTGFGLSFILGVVVAGLVAGPGTILIVENPEAHLHPKAQSAVGEFLGRVSAGGAQVFVETHSEHVLNGMRRMIRKGIITPETTQLLFFSKVPNTFETAVRNIPVSPNGDITDWPDGFFDQLDKDLSELLH